MNSPRVKSTLPSKSVFQVRSKTIFNISREIFIETHIQCPCLFYALLSWCDAHVTTWEHNKSNLFCRVYSLSNCNNKCCSFALPKIRHQITSVTFALLLYLKLKAIADGVRFPDLSVNHVWIYTLRNISWQDLTETEWPNVAVRTLTFGLALLPRAKADK